jgi:acyl-CoA synthetase (AMP-forming)/AMP-acid ligase II
VSGPAGGGAPPAGPERLAELRAVEAVLFEFAAVGDCAALPGPGGAVCAVVVLRPGAKLAVDDLARHCADRLAARDRPTDFILRPGPLPRAADGDVDREGLGAVLGLDGPRAPA